MLHSNFKYLHELFLKIGNVYLLALNIVGFKATLLKYVR